MAESFRSKLVVAQREGVAFDKVTGLPEPMAREVKNRTWYEHAVAFVDMKWPRAAGKQRRSIAEASATVTPALLATERGTPSDGEIRDALYGLVVQQGPPGHGMLLKVYAKCIDGQDEVARRRIEGALGIDDPDAQP